MNRSIIIVIGILGAAMVAAGIMKYHGSTDASGIRKLLNDKDPDVVCAAIESLGEMNDRAAIPALRELISSEYFYLRVRAIDALGKLGDKESIPEIRYILASATDSLSLQSAINALAMLGDTDSIDNIKEFLNHFYLDSATENALMKLGVSEEEVGLLRRDREIQKVKEKGVDENGK